MGKLVLTIMHDMDFVAETFERTIVFSQGQVALDGSTRGLYARAAAKRGRLERPSRDPGWAPNSAAVTLF